MCVEKIVPQIFHAPADPEFFTILSSSELYTSFFREAMIDNCFGYLSLEIPGVHIIATCAGKYNLHKWQQYLKYQRFKT